MVYTLMKQSWVFGQSKHYCNSSAYSNSGLSRCTSSFTESCSGSKDLFSQTILWSLYEIIHICTAVVDESELKSDHCNKFSNLSNWKEEAWKNQGFNGIQTRDLRNNGAMQALGFQISSVTLNHFRFLVQW